MTAAAPGTRRSDVVRGALRDGIWNAAALALPGIANLMILAILIRSLGPAAFAPWPTAAGLLALLTILDAGLSATTARSTARAIAGDEDARALVQASYVAYAWLAVIVVIVGAAAALLVPVVLGIEEGAATSAMGLGVVLALDLAVVIGTSGWFGSLRGARRFDLLVLANAAQVLIAVPLTVALVPEIGLVGAGVGQLAGRLLGRAVAAFGVRRVLDWVRLVPGGVDRVAWRELGLFALPVLAISVSTQLGIGVDPVVVAITGGGAAAVGLFAAGGALARYAAFLLFPVLGVLLPSFSEVTYARPDAAAGILLRCVRLAALIGTLVFGTLALAAPMALEAWIGRSDELSVQVLVLYAVAHAAWTPSQVMILMLIAAGRHRLLGAALLAASVLNLVASVVLALALGPIGVAVSTLIFLVGAHGLVTPAIVAQRLAIPLPMLAAAMATGFAIGATVVGTAALIPLEGRAGLVARVAVAALAAVAAVSVDQSTLGDVVKFTAAGIIRRVARGG